MPVWTDHLRTLFFASRLNEQKRRTFRILKVFLRHFNTLKGAVVTGHVARSQTRVTPNLIFDNLL